MSAIQIEWLSDYSDCDQAGCSGGYCEGARIYVDGRVVLDLIPHASCFGGDHWERDEVYRLLLDQLGHELLAEEGA